MEIQMKKGLEYEFTITGTQFPGTGTAVIDGEKVLIKGAFEGQKIKARIKKIRGSKIEAKISEVLQKADYEVEAFCEQYGICGGCSAQIVPYVKQLEIKKSQVLELFETAGISDFNFCGIEGSSETYGYRNKMEYTFGDFEKDGELTLGMHVKTKHIGVVTTNCCKIVDDDFNIILSNTLEFCRKNKLNYYKVMPHEGFLRNLVIRKAKNTGEILVAIVTTSQCDFSFEELSEILSRLTYLGKLTGIVHIINDSLSDTVKVEQSKILFGRDYIYERLFELNFKIGIETFFQTNSNGAEKLYSIVEGFMENAKDKVIFDLYCGSGTIGQITSAEAKKVIGIELVEQAVRDANENAKLNEITNCNFIAGDVTEIINTIKDKPDIIILDPPRPGVHPKALEHVISFGEPEIIYVSCNPKTLVKDLLVLIEGGYSVDSLKIMDMFPHTPHVECVVKIVRK